MSNNHQEVMKNQAVQVGHAANCSLEEAEGCWWREGGWGPEEKEWLYFAAAGLVLQYPAVSWCEREVHRRGGLCAHFRLLAPGRAEFALIRRGQEDTMVKAGQRMPPHGHFDYEVINDELVIRDQPEGCDTPRVFKFRRGGMAEAPEWFQQNIANDLQRRIDIAWPSL